MKIKLLFDLPIDPRHGMKKDRILEVSRIGEVAYQNVHWWVKDDDGEEVGVLGHEAVVVDEGEES